MNVALALPADVPSEVPLRVTAEGLTRSLSRTETDRALVLLALIARVFALNLPPERLAVVQGYVERLLVDAVIAEQEWDTIERKDGAA